MVTVDDWLHTLCRMFKPFQSDQDEGISLPLTSRTRALDQKQPGMTIIAFQ